MAGRDPAYGSLCSKYNPRRSACVLLLATPLRPFCRRAGRRHGVVRHFFIGVAADEGGIPLRDMRFPAWPRGEFLTGVTWIGCGPSWGRASVHPARETPRPTVAGEPCAPAKLTAARDTVGGVKVHPLSGDARSMFAAGHGRHPFRWLARDDVPTCAPVHTAD